MLFINGVMKSNLKKIQKKIIKQETCSDELEENDLIFWNLFLINACRKIVNHIRDINCMLKKRYTS